MAMSTSTKRIEIYVYSSGAKKAVSDVNSVDKSVRGLGKSLAQNQTELSRWGTIFMRVFRAITAFFVISTITRGISGLGKAIIQASAQLEVYSTQLKVLYGNARDAANAMEFLKKYAIETPFIMTDMMEGAVRIKAFGLNVQKYTAVIGDWAAAMGTTFHEMAIRFGRISIGARQYTRLLQTMGISVIEFNRELALTGNRAEALYNIIGRKFPDMAYKISLTFTGLISNIKDAFLLISAYVGAGLFKEMKEDVEKFHNALRAWYNDKTKLAGWRLELRNVYLDFREGVQDAISFSKAIYKIGEAINALDIAKFLLVYATLKNIFKLITLWLAAPTGALFKFILVPGLLSTTTKLGIAFRSLTQSTLALTGILGSTIFTAALAAVIFFMWKLHSVGEANRRIINDMNEGWKEYADILRTDVTKISAEQVSQLEAQAEVLRTKTIPALQEVTFWEQMREFFIGKYKGSKGVGEILEKWMFTGPEAGFLAIAKFKEAQEGLAGLAESRLTMLEREIPIMKQSLVTRQAIEKNTLEYETTLKNLQTAYEGMNLGIQTDYTKIELVKELNELYRQQSELYKSAMGESEELLNLRKELDSLTDIKTEAADQRRREIAERSSILMSEEDELKLLQQLIAIKEFMSKIDKDAADALEKSNKKIADALKAEVELREKQIDSAKRYFDMMKEGEGNYILYLMEEIPRLEKIAKTEEERLAILKLRNDIVEYMRTQAGLAEPIEALGKPQKDTIEGYLEFLDNANIETYKFVNYFSNAWESVVQGVLSGTVRMKDFFKKFVENVMALIAQLIARMATLALLLWMIPGVGISGGFWGLVKQSMGIPMPTVPTNKAVNLGTTSIGSSPMQTQSKSIDIHVYGDIYSFEDFVEKVGKANSQIQLRTA